MRASVSTLRSPRAFTLVELIIVIGIIMMLVAISVPLLSMMAQRRSLEGAVELMKVEFLQLRERSASTSMPVVAVLEHWTDPMRLVAWSPFRDEVEEEWIWMPVSMVRFPERIWTPHSWLLEVTELETAADLPTGLPMADAVEALLIDTGYAFNEAEVEEEIFEGTTITKERKRCFAFVFMPDGSVQIIGRPKVASWELQVEDPDVPDGDVIMTNGVHTIYMVVNPGTARIDWAKRDHPTE